MPVKPVFYIVNNNKGDNIETPNAFLYDYKGDITFKDIIKSFPLSKLGDYHYRFRVAEGRADSIWIDITDINEVVPLYNDCVFMKCLRCDTIGIQSKYMLNQKSESSSNDKHHHHKDKKEKKDKEEKVKKEKKDKEDSGDKDGAKKEDKKEKREKEQSPQVHPQPTPQPVQQQKPSAPIQQTKQSSTPQQQQQTKQSSTPQQQQQSKPSSAPVQHPPPRAQEEEEEEEDDDDDDDDTDDEELSESEEEVDLFGGGKPKADKTLSQFTGVSYDGKSASVVKAMKKRERELKKKQEDARVEMERQKEMLVQIQEEKDKAIELHGQKIQQWAEENGVKRDIRGLLATMQNVLWEGSGWVPINIGDLLADGKVKMGYFKASRIVHPDKTVDCTPEQKLIAERIFDALNQAWTKFQTESS